MSENSVTMSDAIHGLKRFFEIYKPSRITWGTIYRTPVTDKGKERLDRLITQCKRNLTLAQRFLDTQSPDDTERFMVNLYQESVGDQIGQIEEHRRYIIRALNLEKRLDERVAEYEQASLVIEPLRLEDELPF